MARFSLPFGSETQTDTQTCVVQLLDFFGVNSTYNIRPENDHLEFAIIWKMKSNGTYVRSGISKHFEPGSYSMYENTSSYSFPQRFHTSFEYLDYQLGEGTGLSSFDFTRWYQHLVDSGDHKIQDATLQDILLLGTESTLAPNLGFQDSKMVTVTYGDVTYKGWRFEAFKLSSTRPVQLLYPGSIVLKIDELNTNNRAIGFGLGEVFEIFHTESGFGEVINFQPYLAFPSHIARLQMTGVLTVRLVDVQNQELDLHGMDWTVTLGLQWALDTGTAGFETSNTNHNYLPITNTHPPGYDALDAQRKRPRG